MVVIIFLERGDQRCNNKYTYPKITKFKVRHAAGKMPTWTFREIRHVLTWSKDVPYISVDKALMMFSQLFFTMKLFINKTSKSKKRKSEAKINPTPKKWTIPGCEWPSHSGNRTTYKNCCWYNIARNITPRALSPTLIKAQIIK